MGNSVDHWVFDRRIPVAVLVALLMQTLGFAYWVGSIATQVQHNTDALSSKSIDDRRLTVVETKVDAIQASIQTLSEEVRHVIRSNSRGDRQ